MGSRIYRISVLVCALLFVLSGATPAESGPVQAYITLRVSKLVQKAVIDVGDDLSIEVGITGVVPDHYQWYVDNESIPFATERVYTLVNAQLDDAGLYRMDAFDASGAMILSIDVNVRVIDPTALPKTGDRSLPIAYAFGGLALCGLAVPVAIRKKQIWADD